MDHRPGPPGAYAEYGGVESCGSSGIYDGDLEPVDRAVLFCRTSGVSIWSELERQRGRVSILAITMALLTRDDGIVLRESSPDTVVKCIDNTFKVHISGPK